MNAQVLALVNQKGGVTKSTSCVNLAAGLAQAGKKVLAVDLDPQASLTISLGNPQPDRLPVTISDMMGKVLTDQPIAPGEGILHHPEGFDLMPSDIQLSGMEVSLVNAMSRETILRQYLDTVRKQYTHILLDCQPSLGMLTVNALAAANRIIIPVSAEYLPAKGLEQLLQTVAKVRRQINPKLQIDGILLAMVDNRTKETQPTYSVGDMVELNGQQYEVMAIVADIPTITEGVTSSIQDFLSFYLPADIFQTMYPDNTLRKLFFDVSGEYQPQAETMLIDYRNNVDKSLNFTSKSTLTEHYKEQTRANTVMGFAISLIIAFVGVLNFVNSMVTAIVSRQKEFAMIQSVGMTKRQLRSMLIDEGLYYAVSTLAVSYVLSALSILVGVKMMVAGDWTATFHFTLMPLVICTPALIAFAILTPYICFKNLEKQSIVERLRATD